MQYAKLTDDAPQFAPNPMRIGNNFVGNPPEAFYLEQQYKPVQFSERPEALPGFRVRQQWIETDDAIIQRWTLTEETDLSDGEALDIILGGGGL